jgi:hypothetical protein
MILVQLKKFETNCKTGRRILFMYACNKRTIMKLENKKQSKLDHNHNFWLKSQFLFSYFLQPSNPKLGSF